MVFVQVALDRLDSRGSKVADYLLVIDMQSDYVAMIILLLRLLRQNATYAMFF